VNKIIIGFVVVLVVAVAGAGYYLMQNLDGIVKSLIEEVGTEVTNAQVRVREVKLNLAEGKATLSGLTVANPPGFSTEPLFTLDNISVAIDTSSLTGPVYHIEDISIDGVHVLAEQKGAITNVQKFMDGMPKSDTPDDVGDTGSSEVDIKLAISRIDFSDGTMELRSDQIGNQSIELKKLQLRNIGTPEHGLTPGEVGEKIAGQLVVSVQDALKSALGKYLRKEAEASIRTKLGSLFGRDKD
jgi:uncharacterized protein involved in outer membrane biogenesis|tara:strand:+ start:170 stop:895 length:726 start_codon:yes stop_codon:yes gene_type:complete